MYKCTVRKKKLQRWAILTTLTDCPSQEKKKKNRNLFSNIIMACAKRSRFSKAWCGWNISVGSVPMIFWTEYNCGKGNELLRTHFKSEQAVKEPRRSPTETEGKINRVGHWVGTSEEHINFKHSVSWKEQNVYRFRAAWGTFSQIIRQSFYNAVCWVIFFPSFP